MKSIKSLPLSLRPREKLLKIGPEALTTVELLSAILVTGTKKISVSKLATQIVRILSRQHTLSKNELLNLGLGPTKAAQVLAVIEFGKRLNNADGIVTLTKPEQVYAFSLDIVNSSKESLLCFYLNARGELLKKEILAIGSLNRANLLPREIFSQIKDFPVASIILVHNHPSGSLEPSPDDIRFTKRVKVASEILGVNLLDHLIVSPKGWVRVKI